MHVVKGKKKSVLLRVALLALSVYILFSLVRLRIELNAREQVKAEALIVKQQKEDELALKTDQVSNVENDLEAAARDQGLAQEDESIFQEIPSEQ